MKQLIKSEKVFDSLLSAFAISSILNVFLSSRLLLDINSILGILLIYELLARDINSLHGISFNSFVRRAFLVFIFFVFLLGIIIN